MFNYKAKWLNQVTRAENVSGDYGSSLDGGYGGSLDTGTVGGVIGAVEGLFNQNNQNQNQNTANSTSATLQKYLPYIVLGGVGLVLLMVLKK